MLKTSKKNRRYETLQGEQIKKKKKGDLKRNQVEILEMQNVFNDIKSQ